MLVGGNENLAPNYMIYMSVDDVILNGAGSLAFPPTKDFLSLVFDAGVATLTFNNKGAEVTMLLLYR